MLSFVKPENIKIIYSKIMKKYNNKEFNDFYNYYERNWKSINKNKKINIIPEFNYYNILNSLEIDSKYLFLTNNISEHINKILNSFYNIKYPTFEKWKILLFRTQDIINNNDNIITRHNYLTQVLKFFVQWNIENKNHKDLLDNSTIKKLNSLIMPDSNIGNLIPFSDFFSIYKDSEDIQCSMIIDKNIFEEYNSNDNNKNVYIIKSLITKNYVIIFSNY